MAIERCNNGHYYNNSESASCPYCSGASAIGQTIPLGGGVMDAPDNAWNNTVPVANEMPQQGFGETEYLDAKPTVTPYAAAPISATEFVSNPEYGQSVFMDDKKNSDVKPVRGWLVVVDGEKLGMDFRIHTGKNSLGRGKSNDICFDFDQTISKEKACLIVYDDRNNAFYLQGGESTNNVYVNNEILLQPRKIVDNDIIEVGQTKLVFRALCNEQFNY